MLLHLRFKDPMPALLRFPFIVHRTQPLCICTPLLCPQAVATFSAVGPAANNKSVYQNCVDVVKSGWFTSSTASKELNKATDSWMPGDCEWTCC
jgi:hypothetical protein